jgi:hypothetical protein
MNSRLEALGARHSVPASSKSKKTAMVRVIPPRSPSQSKSFLSILIIVHNNKMKGKKVLVIQNVVKSLPS